MIGLSPDPYLEQRKCPCYAGQTKHSQYHNERYLPITGVSSQAETGSSSSAILQSPEYLPFVLVEVGVLGVSMPGFPEGGRFPWGFLDGAASLPMGHVCQYPNFTETNFLDKSRRRLTISVHSPGVGCWGGLSRNLLASALVYESKQMN